MSVYVFDIVWEGETPLPSEWTLDDVKCPSDIEGHLQDTFGCAVDCFEYIEL